jgi:dimethylargininase
MMRAVDTTGIALVRRPSPRLADGIVTHIERTVVDIALAIEQHAGYVAALRAAGYAIHEVEPADDCPDSVFIEDAVVVVDDLAILTRPGALSRRPEVAGADAAVTELGLSIARIEDPGTLDGGDVLQIGSTIYVGLGGRTNESGIAQFATHVAPLGRTVVAVPLGDVLHLKSAVTALPDGTVLAWPGLVDTSIFTKVIEVDEEPGAHVVPIGGDRVLMSSHAPLTATRLVDLGFAPVTVDISEFEKLEGCVTCLSVLVVPPVR